MKLRINDAIDCTCTAGGWSRELNSAKMGGRDETGVVDALPVKYRGRRQGERVNEWLPICSIPLLERLVPRVQIYPCFTPLSAFPLVTPAPPTIAHTPHTWVQWTADFILPWSYLLVFKYWYAESVRPYIFQFHDFPSVFLSARICSHRSCYILRYQSRQITTEVHEYYEKNRQVS